MRRELAWFAFWVSFGCSGTGTDGSGDPSSGAGGSGGSSAGAAGSSVGGASAGGSGGASGASGAGTGGSAGGSSAGNGGSAGTSGGSGGSGGSAGSAVTCTPGSGTESIAGGALLDKVTCLMWEEMPGFVAAGNWEPAHDYCEALVLAGFDDWRMPTCVELASTPVTFTGRLATAPRYVPDGTGDLANFHYCGVVHWDAQQPRGCGWVGPGNMDGTICVRGEAAVALPAPEGCTCASGTAGYAAVDE